MRIKVSRAEMIERAQRNGYLWGKSLRKGPQSHHGEWRRYCTDHRIALISLSIGRHRAVVAFDLRTIDPGLTFWDVVPLYHDLNRAIEQVCRLEDDRDGVDIRERDQSLAVRGISPSAGFWLTRQFAEVAGHYHRGIVGMPPNVVSLQEYRRKRTYRGIA